MLEAVQVKVRRQRIKRSTTATPTVGVSEGDQRKIFGLEMALSKTGGASDLSDTSKSVVSQAWRWKLA